MSRGHLIALHDWTAEPLALRLLRVAHCRDEANEPMLDAGFDSQLERTSTVEERHETGARLQRLRRSS